MTATGNPHHSGGCNGSASLHDKELVLTVVNPHVSATRETKIGVRGASLKSGTATTLTNSDIHAHNTFDQRNVVSPQTKTLDLQRGSLAYNFPPASVTKLALALDREGSGVQSRTTSETFMHLPATGVPLPFFRRLRSTRKQAG